MPLDPEALSAIAQLGLGLAGFSGIGLVLTRSAGRLQRFELYRLGIMLGTAVGAMFLALLPIALTHFGWAPAVTCRITAGIMAVFSAAFTVYLVFAMRHFRRVVPEIVGPVASRSVVWGHAANGAVQALVVFGVLERCAGWYALGLLWLLGHGTYQFWRSSSSGRGRTWPTEEPAGRRAGWTGTDTCPERHLLEPRRNSMRLSVGCLALTLAAAACDDPAAPAPEVVVVAAEADYALGDVVELTIRNASDEPIVVLTCEGGAFVPEVDRREGGEWERVAGLACLPPTPGFVEIAPGDSARPDYSTIPLHEPGTYRFGFLVTEPPVGPSPELRAVFSQAVEIE